MFAGDLSTHSAPRPIPHLPSADSYIAPVAEVDEDAPDYLSASERLSGSSGIESQDAHAHRFRSNNDSVASSLSNPPAASSPAAAFLSFFNSPPPAPEPDQELNVIAGYTLGPIIGYGSTSIIRRASSSSGTIAAVKIVRRSDLVKAGNAPQARKRLQHEAAVWATLTHEHILPLFSTVHDQYADYFFTLYCPAGSLFDILKRDGTPALPQDDAGMMFRQVVRGLRYLHRDACYVHRDMKLENVLVDEMGLCKIGDFGMSRRIGSEDDDTDDEEPSDPATSFSLSANGALHRAVSLAAPARRPPKAYFESNLQRHSSARHRNSTSANEPAHHFQPGSLPYAAPELLLPQTSDASRPHPSQDIWALGVMLYALLTGRLPFSDPFEPRLQMKILNGSYEIPKDIGRGAERILQGCMEKTPGERWTIDMVDEVAWGVGWGAEGDSAHVAHDEETQTPVSARSKSRSRPAELAHSADSEYVQEEHHARRPFLDAASRRSSSRAQRSLSRAPILSPTHRPSSSRRRSPSSAASRIPRSHSRPPPLSASASHASLSSGGAYAPFLDEFAVDLSPSPPASRSRGRRGGKVHSESRSPSPSVVLQTPPDGARVAAPSLPHPDELILDADEQSGRGRAPVRSDLRKSLVEESDKNLISEDGPYAHPNGMPSVNANDGWRGRPTNSLPR